MTIPINRTITVFMPRGGQPDPRAGLAVAARSLLTGLSGEFNRHADPFALLDWSEMRTQPQADRSTRLVARMRFRRARFGGFLGPRFNRVALCAELSLDARPLSWQAAGKADARLRLMEPGEWESRYDSDPRLTRALYWDACGFMRHASGAASDCAVEGRLDAAFADTLRGFCRHVGTAMGLRRLPA